ncbi:MAG: MraZ protein [Pseudoalteromonas tetraodonis]|jgi:MraZ protein
MEANQPELRRPIFAGTVQHSLDEKHRVTVPARWRKAGAMELFAIPDPRQPILILLTELEMQLLGAELDALSGLDPVARRSFKRQFFAKAEHCPMDKQGRLVLPSDLCGELSFEGEVVLVGGGARIEVWSPDRWKSVCDQEKEAFSSIADKLGL